MSRLEIGCCISAHGFGHAARILAVMEALSSLKEIKLTVLSQVPDWFIRSSFSGSYSLYPIQTDVGLVQQTSFEEDVPATLRVLADFYPVRPDAVDRIASYFSNCHLVVCDIAPIGILAARKAGIPSILLENFTWDWIYEGYATRYPELKQYIEYIAGIYRNADYRIQAMPVCDQKAADLVVSPVARPFRQSRDRVRQRLEMNGAKQMVLVSMGGVGFDALPLHSMQEDTGRVFVISGYRGETVHAPNVRFLEPDSDFYHPDLVAASDAVIGKVGYSTLAEVYLAGVPFGYVSRPSFRESAPLVSFIREHMAGAEIDLHAFYQGQWLEKLPQLLQMNSNEMPGQNGAAQSAGFLQNVAEANTK